MKGTRLGKTVFLDDLWRKKKYGTLTTLHTYPYFCTVKSLKYAQ